MDEYSVPCPDKIIVHGVDYAGLLVVLDVADGRLLNNLQELDPGTCAKSLIISIFSIA